MMKYIFNIYLSETFIYKSGNAICKGFRYQKRRVTEWIIYTYTKTSLKIIDYT